MLLNNKNHSNSNNCLVRHSRSHHRGTSVRGLSETMRIFHDIKSRGLLMLLLFCSIAGFLMLITRSVFVQKENWVSGTDWESGAYEMIAQRDKWNKPGGSGRAIGRGGGRGGVRGGTADAGYRLPTEYAWSTDTTRWNALALYWVITPSALLPGVVSNRNTVQKQKQKQTKKH